MPSFNEADVSDKPIGIRHRPALTPQRLAAIREAYQQQIESLLSVDDGVKAIVDAVPRLGRARQHADCVHGRQRLLPRAAPRPVGKGAPVRAVHSCPAAGARARRPKDRHLEQMTANIDLAPTMVDAANAKAAA